ncbi:unnamed protein product [Moneuplotes crassus]|uniref:Hexose transporter 1 n=1 Tax=Euplotes crassus TaxID=5936 RepID=A0AAD1U4C5_EUPCR|nr:unnamed protein product [Moneuplotes crassus]
MGHFHFGYLAHTMSILWNLNACIYGFDPENARIINMTVIGIFLVSATIGAGFSWKLARYGKRKALIISALICLIGSFFLYIRSLPTMIIGEIIIGLGFGITSAVAPLFTAEIAKRKYIEYCTVTTQFWLNIGFILPWLLEFLVPRLADLGDSLSLTANIYSKLIKSSSTSPDFCSNFEDVHIIWRELRIPNTVVPAIQLLILFLIFKRENPTYVHHCMNNSIQKESIESAGNTYDSSINYEEDSRKSLEIAESLLSKDTWKNLWTLSERKKLIASCILRGFQQITGVNIILNYGLWFVYDQRFPRINLAFTLVLSSMIFLIPSVFILKRFGRKNLFMTAMIVSCLCCGILFQMVEEVTVVNGRIPVFHSLPNLVSAVTICIYFISFWLNFASIPVLYCTETLTDKGMALSTAFQLGLTLLLFSLPTLTIQVIELIHGRPRLLLASSFFFFIFSGLSMLGFFCAALFIIETKGKSKQQISNDFKERVFSFQSSELS